MVKEVYVRRSKMGRVWEINLGLVGWVVVVKTNGEVLDLFLVTFRFKQTLSGQAKRSREKQKEHPHRTQGECAARQRETISKDFHCLGGLSVIFLLTTASFYLWCKTAVEVLTPIFTGR